MVGEQATCENKGCDVVYTKKTHNQKYHDDECCRLATNAKIMEKYYQRQAQRLGKKRNCTVCEGALSRYNSDTVCNSCSLKREKERNESAMSMLNSIAWQS